MADEEGLLALAGQIQEACLSRGLTVSVAESCTGGLLGHLLT
ncbi:MAG: CinA family protein, partial [Chloroflexi bacterium]|nr:CinA family protein [Chloroflexota bacterium]